MSIMQKSLLIIFSNTNTSADDHMYASSSICYSESYIMT
jgi:hypothetical protein